MASRSNLPHCLLSSRSNLGSAARHVRQMRAGLVVTRSPPKMTLCGVWFHSPFQDITMQPMPRTRIQVWMSSIVRSARCSLPRDRRSLDGLLEVLLPRYGHGPAQPLLVGLGVASIG